jgi:membrane-associated phospholipid phosphatase
VKTAATALAALCCLCASAASEAQPRPRWIGGLAMDRDASRALRATDAPTRRAADTVSWVVVGGLMAAPVAVAASATLERAAPVTAAGEALIALAIPYASTALLGFAAKYAFARERPYATREGLLRRCARGDERGCDWDRNGSFPSLHSALGFAAAGALCVQTLRFGSQGAGDAIGCGLATMSATVGATLRMVADKHYVTDVIVGSLLGLGISTALSWAVHFAPGAPLPLASALYSDRIEPLPVVLGGVLGVFVGAMGVTALSAQWR